MTTAKRRQLAFSVIMALVMTSILSATLTAFNLRPDESFLSRWPVSLLLAFAVAFPLVYLLPARLRAWIDKHVK